MCLSFPFFLLKAVGPRYLQLELIFIKNRPHAHSIDNRILDYNLVTGYQQYHKNTPTTASTIMYTGLCCLLLGV
jgi:hypothetical protein